MTTEIQPFTNYSELKLPSGLYLFFPQLIEEQRDRRRARPTRVERVTIVATRGQDGISGVIAGSVLHVDLDERRFFELLKHLEKRDLKNNPIRFAYDVDADESLVRLLIDGELIERAQHPVLDDGPSTAKSDINQLKSA